MSVRAWPTADDVVDGTDGWPDMRHCLRCGRSYVSANDSHTLCRECWAIPLLLDRAAALLGLPPRNSDEWCARVSGLARALASAMKGNPPGRGGVA